MLSNRLVFAELNAVTSEGVARGCSQGGVLSPTLWCLVVHTLLWRLNSPDVYAQAYPDDVAILLV